MFPSGLLKEVNNILVPPMSSENCLAYPIMHKLLFSLRCPGSMIEISESFLLSLVLFPIYSSDLNFTDVLSLFFKPVKTLQVYLKSFFLNHDRNLLQKETTDNYKVHLACFLVSQGSQTDVAGFPMLKKRCL